MGLLELMEFGACLGFDLLTLFDAYDSLVSSVILYELEFVNFRLGYCLA